MSPEERTHLKGLVDSAVRAKTAVRDANRMCAECGGEWDNVTIGCKRCSDRKCRRQRFGHRDPKLCVTCGGRMDELNRGCRTCRERFKRRGRGRNGDFREYDLRRPPVEIRAAEKAA